MLTFEEIQNEVEKDLKIDDTELDLESIRTPQIHNKYLKLFSNYSLQYYKLKGDYKVLYREKWEYYTGKSSPEVYKEKPFDLKILKTDVGIYLDSDSDLQKLSQRIEYIKQIINYLEKVLRDINNRNWAIKNSIDFKKFLHGE